MINGCFPTYASFILAAVQGSKTLTDGPCVPATVRLSDDPA